MLHRFSRYVAASTVLLILAAMEQAVYAFQSRGEGGLFFKVLLAVLYAVVAGMLLRRPVSGAIAATAINEPSTTP